MKTTILLSLLFFFDLACKKNSTQPDLITTPIEFQNVTNARGFRMPSKGTAIIRTDSTWMAYWNSYWMFSDGYGNKTPPPTIDFSKVMVIAVFYGYGTYSGCHDTVNVIQKIESTGGVITVTLGKLSPLDLGICDAIVGPIQMVSIPRSSLNVQFDGEVP